MEQFLNLQQYIFFALLFFLMAISVFVSVVFVVRFYLLRHSGPLSRFKKSILLITLPRESVASEKGKTPSLQEVQESIGVMEAIFSNISGLKKLAGFKSLFSGDINHLSFELVAKNGLISFYVATPNNLKQFVVQQIHAQYPSASIEEVEDYNIFSPKGYIDSAYLQLSKNSLLPIKTYKQLQSDPMNAIVNVLSKIEQDDGAVIQFMVRPTNVNWRIYGAKVVSDVRSGKSLTEAMKSQGGAGLGFLKSFIIDIVGSIFGQTTANGENSDLGSTQKTSAKEDESIKNIEEKISRPGLGVNIRIVVSADKKEQMSMYMDNIINSFGQFNIYEYGNSFKISRPIKKSATINNFIYRNFNKTNRMILNPEEISSLFHLPTQTIQTPNIQWLSSKDAPAPDNMIQDGIVLGENIYREKKTLVKIGREDRSRHTYVVGKSGTGKSEFLAGMARQDILNGDGVAVIDPHGDLVNDILDTIPAERAEDVIYFDPSNIDRPMGLNLLDYDKNYPEQKTFVINEMIRIFDKLYDLKATGGPMFEQYMRNSMLLIMDDTESGSTLMEISKVLADPDFRKYKLSKCSNSIVRDFWEKEAEKAGGEAALANMVPYITSKLNTFVSNDIMRPIIGQQESSFDLRKVMDEKKILLVNLSKGKIGELNAHLLGMVLVGKILVSALSRTDMPRDKRSDFYLYLDEFQNFITDSISVILSEARKYRLNLNIAHQYIGQLTKNQDTSVRDAIFGNVGTMVSFKVGADDAEFLEKEFAPVFSAYDLVNVDKFNAYVKLIIENQPSRAFNMSTFPLDRSGGVNIEKLKQLSSLKYGKDRSLVESEILKRGKSAIG